MEKPKRWQFYLILAVILLTLYNIFPTILWYSKPLHKPIDPDQANQIAEQIVERVDSLEPQAIAWVDSFAHLLSVKPNSVQLKQDDPRIIEVEFNNTQDADTFRRFLPRAGMLIPFVPSQLEVYTGVNNDPKKVRIARTIGVHLTNEDVETLFHYYPKYVDGKISPEYRQLIYDRLTQLALILGGTSNQARQLEAIAKVGNDTKADELALLLAKEIVEVDQTLGSQNPSAVKRIDAYFVQSDSSNKAAFIQKYTEELDGAKKRLATEKDKLADLQKKAVDQKQAPDPSTAAKIAQLSNNLTAIDKALIILKNSASNFNVAQTPLTEKTFRTELASSETAPALKEGVQIVSLKGSNPYVESLVIDWNADTITLKLYSDVQNLLSKKSSSESTAFAQEKLNQMVINEIARISQQADEAIHPLEENYGINLNSLSNSTGFLALDLKFVSQKQIQQLLNQLTTSWNPQTRDFTREAYPIRTYKSWNVEKPDEKRLGLVLYAPVMENQEPAAGFHKGSIYVIARGMEPIIQKYQAAPDDPASQKAAQDFNDLKKMLESSGFIDYPGSAFGLAPEFSKDYIFELQDNYSTLLSATRENFEVRGSKRQAVLPLTDLEQRIITVNNIEDKIQEDLLKWKEEYQTSQVDINATNRYLVPAPTENPYWTNFKLSLKKYFRGDESKVLKWGLDLSGGKTVRIGLRDQNNRKVTDPEDLKQAVNELYTRINKLGVSERSIRIENDTILLEFPGSQALSASELVKASAMYFHVANEKFNNGNAELRNYINTFLQEVWNEAVVTNRKGTDEVNLIAWEHLGGVDASETVPVPRSEAASVLFDNGLRIANPKTEPISNGFDDTLSSIGILKGDEFSDWGGQTHPLLVLFHNYALEGSSLNNIQVGYDPTQGNVLTFSVKKSYEGNRSGNPRDDFYSWTSNFAEDRIVGTPKETYTHGSGWRMAVLLNGKIISSPALRSALSDGATISGRFTQREINQLASDLKAGSLSFTPVILSEQNVSPQLGVEERTRGILASIIAVILVVVAMAGYYRFAGLVASCAVLFNILIMWGVLQNIDAAVSLPVIAGIVLTIGMAVDANVLVFERVREEFKHTGRIASSIAAGYRKAFSAIVDSNITTIIAAVILIQFDSGPIKGFAVALIIGIVSSMFTSLFMTRYFFANWVQNPKHKHLSMMEWIGKTNFDFLGKTKQAVTLSLIVMIAGLALFYSQRHTILGMDFTGGYSLTVELEPQPEDNYRHRALEAFLNNGASFNDVEVRELTRPNQLRIQLGMGLEQAGHPFYQLPEELTEGKFKYEFEKNPRIEWVYNTLQKANLHPLSTELNTLQNNWTIMSGQLSETMRNNAIIALFVAMLSILIYITIRFEFKYAVGAVIGLIHDVLITLGVMAFFHWLGYPVELDLQVIGAIMTIIGYSLNDTIIVFDRIREELKTMRKSSFPDIINHALNVTLSRTLMTSGTTMLVLLALVLFGGESIFGFSLVMTIGVIVGTLSSLFIASPVLLFFHNREVESAQEATARG